MVRRDEDPDRAGHEENENGDVVRGSLRQWLVMTPERQHVQRAREQDEVLEESGWQRAGVPAHDVKRHRRRREGQRPASEPEKVYLFEPQDPDMLATRRKAPDAASQERKRGLWASMPLTESSHVPITRPAPGTRTRAAAQPGATLASFAEVLRHQMRFPHGLACPLHPGWCELR